MRRIFAVFLIAVTLSGCAQKPAFEELADGPCTGAQYAMLVENQGYKFDSCTISNSSIKQEVSVTSGDEVFNLTYRLSVVESKLGVESAAVSTVDTPLTV
jgi:hypothetical protein